MPNTIQKILEQTLKKIKNRLEKHKIDQLKISDLNFDLTLLLAHIINKPKEFIYIHPEFVLNFKQRITFWWLTEKYYHSYPIAYLIGYKNFFKLKFFVSRATLIPRPDTEIMTEMAIEIVKDSPDCTIIDIGTGSGCIPISILKNIKTPTTTIATDISPQALNTAQKNADYHQVKIDFRVGNLLSPIKIKDIPTNNLVITANLPYLTKRQTADEKSIKREPWGALYGGYDGLEFYRELINQLTNLFSQRKPKKIWLLLEIDPDQKNSIKKIISQEIPQAKIKIQLDLAGLDRLVVVEF